LGPLTSSDSELIPNLLILGELGGRWAHRKACTNQTVHRKMLTYSYNQFNKPVFWSYETLSGYSWIRQERERRCFISLSEPVSSQTSYDVEWKLYDDYKGWIRRDKCRSWPIHESKGEVKENHDKPEQNIGHQSKLNTRQALVPGRLKKGIFVTKTSFEIRIL